MIVPNDEISPRVANLINLFNDDAREAFTNGVNMTEAIAIAGSITQTLLQSIHPSERVACWEAMCRIMNRRFAMGEL